MERLSAQMSKNHDELLIEAKGRNNLRLTA